METAWRAAEGTMATPQLMTYMELAEVWGVSKEAARKKVEGLRLPKQMGNDGRARVMVDLTEVQHEPMKPKPHGRRPPGDQLETTPETEDLRRLVSTLEAEVARLTALNASQRADFERERDRADRTAGELAATRDTLTADLANLRDALATMTAERDTERARAAQVEALQTVLEIERQRVTEWQAAADRWATQAERRRGFLRWFRRAS